MKKILLCFSLMAHPLLASSRADDSSSHHFSSKSFHSVDYASHESSLDSSYEVSYTSPKVPSYSSSPDHHSPESFSDTSESSDEWQNHGYGALICIATSGHGFRDQRFLGEGFTKRQAVKRALKMCKSQSFTPWSCSIAHCDLAEHFAGDHWAYDDGYEYPQEPRHK